MQVRIPLIHELDGEAGAALRYFLWRRHANRDTLAAEKFATNHEKHLVNIYRSSILDSTKTKTLFILGSGWSVNELTDPKLLHIAAHQSIAINFWFFHTFVPTAFSFDSGKVPQGQEKYVEQLIAKLGSLFARQEIWNSNPNILYLRPYQSNPGYLVPCPPGRERSSWVTGRANLLSRSPKAVEADLRFVTQQVALGEAPNSALPDNGSSVVRLVFLALAQGFKDIVLVGVDGDTRPHFWFHPEYRDRYPEYVALFPDPDGRPHGTTEGANRALGNNSFLSILGRVLGEKGLATLWVGTSTSLLSDSLPQYLWPAEVSRDS